MLLNSLTISMFGLEKQLWEETPKGEQKMYIWAFLFFVFFMILAITSGITLLYIITSSIFISIPFGLVLAFVVGSILRFSLVILRKSIFDIEKIKPEKKVEKVEKVEIVENNLPEGNGIASSNELLVQNNFATKIKNINQKSKRVLTSFTKIKFLKSDSPIPMLTGIIRFSILTVIGLLVLFPLVCLLHFNKIKETNELKREAYINQFVQDDQESLEMETAYLKATINNTENEINQQNGLLKDKSTQLNKLNQQLSDVIIKHNQDFESKLMAFREDISNRYFIVHSFKAVTQFPFFIMAFFLIAFLLISPHFILFRLKTNKKFVYADLSTKYYKQRIEEKYVDNQKQILRFLQENFQYTPPIGYETIIWENPPYCTQKSQHFKLRNKLDKDELITSITKPLI
jgi:hypothetical protein